MRRLTGSDCHDAEFKFSDESGDWLVSFLRLHTGSYHAQAYLKDLAGDYYRKQAGWVINGSGVNRTCAARLIELAKEPSG